MHKTTIWTLAGGAVIALALIFGAGTATSSYNTETTTTAVDPASDTTAPDNPDQWLIDRLDQGKVPFGDPAMALAQAGVICQALDRGASLEQVATMLVQGNSLSPVQAYYQAGASVRAKCPNHWPPVYAQAQAEQQQAMKQMGQPQDAQTGTN